MLCMDLADQSFWTTKKDGQVRLRMEKNSLASESPVTVHDMFLDTATKFSNSIALCSKHRDGWQVLTYMEYYEECRKAAKAFLRLGLERFHSVGIIGVNSEEWVISSLGAIMAGGFSVGILTTDSAKTCQVIAENSKVQVIVVDGTVQLQKIQGFLKSIKAVVQYKEDIRAKLPNLYSWSAFLALAVNVSDEMLDHVIDSQKPNQCCTLVYSHTTSGPPKAIMLSHDNITWTTSAIVQSLSFNCPPEGQETMVSYLPLSCFSSQLFDVWVSIYVAGVLYFAEPDALRGSLLDTLREVRPTTFYGVPQVWDRMLDKMRTTQLAASGFRRKLDAWAMRLRLRIHARQMLGQERLPLCSCLARRLTFDPARRFLGLDQCRQLFNTGIGLPMDTLLYFLSLDIPICELYSLDECTGVHALGSPGEFRPTSCGKELPGTHTKIIKQEEEGTVGAVHVWGRHVFMGYLHNKASTQETLDAYGWLHTGDMGYLDEENFLYLSGNVQEMITLKSGEKINPLPMEERLKLLIPIARYVVLVGQDAPYLCALLTLKCQVNPESGEPRDALTTEAVGFCQHLKSTSTRLTDILYDGDPIITEFINQAVNKVNSEATEPNSKIIKWRILDTDFTMESGELGANTKVKRALVTKMYQAEIENFYEEDEEEED
ncbi:long-chain-fatty-acid--CoA ligase ACSBG2-like [Echinops telfairi]|uniref:long-chain-fatty-acid--CoA ligase n=1 Tax=Echinops telfairi TaxID=9371 RepID=A0ABM0J450_ECHTE|nr:long-chain-fatty-acid--CoA ligase ACSBG2-like [Echinops telfairi]